MKKLLLSSLLPALFLFTLAPALAADTTVNGYVSDSFCGAKGASESHAGCMAKCVAKGAKTVVVTDGDQKVLTVDNPEALQGDGGHHVSITGAVNGDSRGQCEDAVVGQIYLTTPSNGELAVA